MITRDCLNRLESTLNTERFVRIHRSAIVNLDRVAHLEPNAGGEYVVTLRDGRQLKASRRHVGPLLRAMRGQVREAA